MISIKKKSFFGRMTERIEDVLLMRPKPDEDMLEELEEVAEEVTEEMTEELKDMTDEMMAEKNAEKMVQSDMKGDLEALNSYFPDKYKKIDYRV